MTRSGACALMLAGACTLAGAQTATDRGVHGTLGTTVQHDSNVFRLPEGVRPVDVGLRPDASGESRGDTVTSTVAALELALVASRQRLSASLSQRDTHLSRYSEFDTRTHRVGLRWQWELGNDWSGAFAADEDQNASELRDLIGSRRNVLTVRHALAQATWRPRPDRRITWTTERYRGRNDVPARATLDYDAQVHALEGAWRTGVGNEWSLRMRRSDNRYPQRLATPGHAPGYEQTDADLGLALRPGGRTRADLRLGRGQRQHSHQPERSYDGPVGRAAVWWDAIRELTLHLELARDLNAADTFQRPFAIGTRRTAGAQLALTPLVQLDWTWSQRRTDYAGGLLSLPPEFAFDARDRITTSRLGVTWSPDWRWQVNAAMQRGRQDSTGITRPYTHEAIDLGVQYSF